MPRPPTHTHASDTEREECDKCKRAAYMREWCEKNREKVRETNRATRERRRDKHNAYQQQWRENNRERHREYSRNYHQAHPECAKAASHKRKHKLRSPGHFTGKDWKRIQKQQNNTCAFYGTQYETADCESKGGVPCKLTVDHIVPLSKGGSNAPDNIQGLCMTCNKHKYNKMWI